MARGLTSIDTDAADKSVAVRQPALPAAARARRTAAQPAQSVERAEQLSSAAIALALDMTSEAALFLTEGLRIVGGNAAALESWKVPLGRLQGLRLADILSDDRDGTLSAALARLIRRERIDESVKAQQLAPDGRWMSVLVQLKRLDVQGESLLVAVVRKSPIMPIRRDGVRRNVDLDHVTSLPTRPALEHRLRRAQGDARRRASRYAVLFIDVDRFKSVNDTHGHCIGDEVLRTVARRLHECMRPGDFVARYGGDEFVALVADIHDDTESQRIADRARDALKMSIDVPSGVLHVTASVGAAISQSGLTAFELLHEADQAMYRAKRELDAAAIGQERARDQQAARSESIQLFRLGGQ